MPQMARDLLMSQTPRAGVRPVEIKDITTFVQRVFGTYVHEVGGALSSRRDGFLLIQGLPQAAALSPSRCFSPRRTDTMVGPARDAAITAEICVVRRRVRLSAGYSCNTYVPGASHSGG
jgi:hypothetical protein